MIKEIFEFLNLSHDFRDTKRNIYATGTDRKENDAEHSYQLALFVMYVADAYHLDIDVGKAVKYAIVHDLTEVFDGDKNIFDTVGRADKKEREQIAAQRITKMFPEWIGFRQLIEDYENLVDEESRLVNGLDKVLPVINIILDDGKTWKNEATTLGMILENKRRTTAVHPISAQIWREIDPILIERELELFGKTSSEDK